MEVSSPGLDQQLRKEADFVRFGREAENGRPHRRTPPGGAGSSGCCAARAGQVSLELEDALAALALEDVDRAKLVPEP